MTAQEPALTFADLDPAIDDRFVVRTAEELAAATEPTITATVARHAGLSPMLLAEAMLDVMSRARRAGR